MLTNLRITGFKSYGPAGMDIPLSHVVLLLGPNSSGKSSVLQVLRLMQQSWRSLGECGALRLDGPLVSLGTFRNVVHGQADDGVIQFEFTSQVESGAGAASPRARRIRVTAQRSYSGRTWVYPIECELIGGGAAAEDDTDAGPVRLWLSAAGEIGPAARFEFDPCGASSTAVDSDPTAASALLEWKRHKEKVEVSAIVDVDGSFRWRVDRPAAPTPPPVVNESELSAEEYQSVLMDRERYAQDRREFEDRERAVETLLAELARAPDHELDVAGSPLAKRLRGAIELHLEPFLRELASVRHLGELRRPELGWIPSPAERVGSVGMDGAALLQVLASDTRALEGVNGALRAITGEYQVEISHARTSNPHADEFHNPMVSLRLRQKSGESSVQVGLGDVGSGIRQLLPILAEYEVLRLRGEREGLPPGILCVEQPELHLHPKMQAATLMWLCGFEKPDGAGDDGEIDGWIPRSGASPQVILETHGEVLTLRAGRLVREGRLNRDSLSVVAVSRGPGRVSTATRMEPAGEGWHPGWPDGFFAERWNER